MRDRVRVGRTDAHKLGGGPPTSRRPVPKLEGHVGSAMGIPDQPSNHFDFSNHQHAACNHLLAKNGRVYYMAGQY